MKCLYNRKLGEQVIENEEAMCNKRGYKKQIKKCVRKKEIRDNIKETKKRKEVRKKLEDKKN